MAKGVTLLTGFEPFQGWAVNSSWEAVRGIASGGSDLKIACLPVDHARAGAAIRDLIRKHRPARVLLCGLADRPVPTLEMQARLGPALEECAEPTRRGRWPFFASLRRMQAAGVPARLSADAGRYVCETTYWAALGTNAPQVAFLHLPPVSAQWPTRRLSRAVAALLH